MARAKDKHQFRAVLSEKLMDLGNLAVAALVLGQFVSGRELLLTQFLAGIAVLLICYIISYVISR